MTRALAPLVLLALASGAWAQGVMDARVTFHLAGEDAPAALVARGSMVNVRTVLHRPVEGDALVLVRDYAFAPVANGSVLRTNAFAVASANVTFVREGDALAFEEGVRVPLDAPLGPDGRGALLYGVFEGAEGSRAWALGSVNVTGDASLLPTGTGGVPADVLVLLGIVAAVATFFGVAAWRANRP